MLKPRLAATAAVLAVLALSGCSAFSEDSASDDGELKVVTGLYPLEWVSKQVIGDRGSVTDLTQPGQEPHDLELSPAQTAQVTDADLVVYEAGLQASVDDAVEQATGTAFDVSDAAALEPVDHLSAGEDHGGHEHGAEEHGAEEHGAEEDGHDHGHDHGEMGDLDPHFWHDPERMADVATALADQLAEVDPDHADEYTANAERVGTQLSGLARDFRAGLAGCQRNTVVVSHDAFSYLANFGVEIAPIAGLSPDAEPTPADLAELQQLIKTDGITTVFSERLAPPQLSETLAKDAGVRTAVLDPIEGLTDETAEEDYLSLMRQNLAALQKANGCQ